MTKYRRRTTAVEAERWTGDNLDAIKAFLGVDYAGIDHGDIVLVKPYGGHGPWRMPVGHWIVREDGRHRCVAPDIFDRTYVAWRLDPELNPLWAAGDAEIIRLYRDEMWSTKRIAEKFGCSPKRVNEFLRARGAEIRSLSEARLNTLRRGKA